MNALIVILPRLALPPREAVSSASMPRPPTGPEASVRTSVTPPHNLGFVAEVTVCPRSSDPFYKVSYYIKWGHYFLDIQ